MEKTRLAAAMAAVVVCAVVASSSAHAQTTPLEVWQPPQHSQLDPAKRVPQNQQPAPVTGEAPAVTSQQQAVAEYPQATAQPQPYTGAPATRSMYEEDRGGFFIGAYAGKGWVFEDIDQNAFMGSAGYRWQAGPVTLIGIEVAGGRLDDTTDGAWRFGSVDFGSVGVNARFNFGRGNPVYGLVRSGYMSAEENYFGERVDGAYLGLGLGVDFSRHFNMSLVYTHHLYFDDYYWDGGLYYDDINSAETLMLGGEARF